MCMQDFQIGQRITARRIQVFGAVNTYQQIAPNPNRVGVSIQSQDVNCRIYNNEGKTSGTHWRELSGSGVNSYAYLSSKDYGDNVTGTIYLRSTEDALSANVWEYVIDPQISQIINGEL